MPKNPKIIQPEGKPEVPFEILAESIVKLGAVAKAFDASRLNRKALVTLIQFETKLSRETISTVLDALGNLEKIYLKPKK